MAKVRIYEWAKKNKMQSAAIVKDLSANGIKVRNHTSSVDEEILVKFFLNKKEEIKPDNKSVDNVVKENKEEIKKETETTKINKDNDKKINNRNNNNNQGNFNNRNNSNNQGNFNNRNNNNNQGNFNNRNNNNNQGNFNNRNNNNNQGNFNNRNNNNNQGSFNNRNNNNQNGFNKPFNKDFKNKNDKKDDSVDLPKEEGKKVTKKKHVPKKNNTYDRFKFFDKEDTKGLENGKTKTQLKKEAREERQKEKSQETTIVKWTDDMTVSKFAQLIDIPVTDVIAKLFELGIMTTVNQNISLDVAEVIIDDYNVEIIEDDSNSEIDFDNLLPTFKEEDKEKRPPIVTIMGHVDHGKTTLLDYLRKSNVTEREAGGITQHIGAYQIVAQNGEKITFLDTPGHEAFSAMRARGADITDITILVIAADDGIMPQTKEAIDHIKAAQKPIIVAITKIDKQDSNPEKILGELAENGIMAEEWGGETPVVKLSAHTGEGIDTLLDYIKLVSDLNEYKASYKGRGVGTVLEAHLDKGRGAVATILLEEGQLSVKDSIVIGNTWGTIRDLKDEYGKKHDKIEPSMPVEITGLKDVPQAGDLFFAAQSTKEAQSIGEKRAEVKRQKDRGGAFALSLEELNNMISSGDIKDLPVIIKADAQGSAEALASSLEKIEVSGVKVKVVAKGVGAINESDVLLASANKTIIIGFNVRPDAGAKQKIEKEGIELIVNNIIYKIIEQIEDSMQGMKEKKYTEDVVGTAQIIEVFKISNVGKVGGAIVNSGKITRKCKMRLIREGVVLYDGEIGQLKRFKDDVSEVIEGQDCGLSFENYQDIKKGDEIEAYLLEEVLS